ncbi:MAG: hypothetical protein ACF8QF_09450 [Phycisphaerales bacterium]
MGRHGSANLFRYEMAYRREIVRARSTAKRIEPKCHHCGYSLRRLHGADVCPECGARIEWRPAWWRDGRFPIWLVGAVGLLPVGAIVAWEFLGARIAGASAPAWTLPVGVAGCLLATLIGLPVARSRAHRLFNRRLRTLLFFGVVLYGVGLVEMTLRLG